MPGPAAVAMSGVRVRARFLPLLFVAALCLAATAGAAASAGETPAAKTATAQHPQFPVPKPPFSPGIFPCSDCHKDMKPNPTRRELKDEHTNIVLNHAQGQRWCLDCHDTNDRDRLHLVNGQRIRFEESYLLCGQCHGDKYRDGMWNGEKQYLLCVHCHNPHDPAFKPIQPMPPPVRPENIRK
jgi:uncharacterized CHY-type Zn-finger protein